MKKRMTICILQNSIRTVASFRTSYLRKLIKDGYNIYCIAPMDDKKALSIIQELGVIVLPVKHASLFRTLLSMNYRAIKLLLSNRSDIIFVSHFVVTTILLTPTLLISPRVLCVIEGIGTAFTNHTTLRKLLRITLILLANKRVFMNQFELDQLGIYDDCVLGGIGVDLEKFKPATDSESRVATAPINMLYVGRLVEDKGVRDLFSLMRLLQDQGVSFIMNIVGEPYPANSGSLEPKELQQALEEFGDSLVLHGYSNNVIDSYHKADFLLLLSRHEGFPVCVMEANACGIPAIAYDVPGCSHAIKDGVNGQLFPLGDIHMVADAIITRQFSKMNKSARKYAQLHFDEKSKADDLINNILSLR